MAIYHAAIKPVRRSQGRSGVGAAAYRIGERLLDERTGEFHDYRLKQGVEFTETFVPVRVEAKWARDTAALWNAAEAAETRCDSRVAREIEVALPHELDAEQRKHLVRVWSQHLADEYGVAVQAAIHAPVGKTDERNHHAHILMTRREVGPDGLGEYSHLEIRDGDLRALGLPSGREQYVAIRKQWAETANRELARAGLDLRIDHRSFKDRGLDLIPTTHMGVRATELVRKGRTDLSQVRINEEARAYNAQLIADDPSQVLTLLTDERSVFDRHDIARCINRYIDDPELFQSVLAKVLASPELEELQPETNGNEARVSTRDMIGVEVGMAHAVDRLAHAGRVDRKLSKISRRGWTRFAVGQKQFERAIKAPRPYALAPEQIAAVAHVTGPERVSCVVGLAGAGKSTMLGTAKLAWEADGHRVLGATLAGKAAEELQAASGIESRTLASYQYAWERDPDRTGPSALRAGDVLVIDEAGMVGSRQMAEFVSEVERVGAKLVLVGDPEQLQPINAGAAFRSIMHRVGFAQMDQVRRQHVLWQREASVELARHETADALRRYIEHGRVGFSDTKAQARERVVADVLRDLAERPDDTRMVLTHRRKDVRALNLDIRSRLLLSGAVGEGEIKRGVRSEERVAETNPAEAKPWDPKDGGLNPNVRFTSGRTYETNDGARDFVTGDRFLFLENDRRLDVKNGMLGTVVRAGEGEIVVRLDARGGGQSTERGGEREGERGGDPSRMREVTVPTDTYRSFDHGYATTIHKSQGSTVDRTYVLASSMMDRHLTYVAMTRHRGDVRLYAGRDDFKTERALIATLARENLKETTLDYGAADGMGPEIGSSGAGPQRDGLAKAGIAAGGPSERAEDRSSLWELAVAAYAALRGIERESHGRAEPFVRVASVAPDVSPGVPNAREARSHNERPIMPIVPAVELPRPFTPTVTTPQTFEPSVDRAALTVSGEAAPAPTTWPRAEHDAIQAYLVAYNGVEAAKREGRLLPHHEVAARKAAERMEERVDPLTVRAVHETLRRSPNLLAAFDHARTAKGPMEAPAMRSAMRALHGAVGEEAAIQENPVRLRERQEIEERVEKQRIRQLQIKRSGPKLSI